MSKPKTRHLRVAVYVNPDDGVVRDFDYLVANMKTRKYTWSKTVAEGIECVEQTDGGYNGNEIDGDHKIFLQRVLKCEAIGYRKVVIG